MKQTTFTVVSLALCLSISVAGNLRLTGIEQLTQLESIPLLQPGVQVHYVGSIDKRGKNADWDWWLYPDTRTNEWVLCEADGPGCLWNFVAHHAVKYSDPTYRFYFDGSETPAFEIKHSEFGSKPPFVAPLADKFIPSVDSTAKNINFQIVRSFCPMPFAKSLKITSSVKMEGNHLPPGGGWGQAIWHSYSSTDGIRTFTGKEDYSKLLDAWAHVGTDPKPTEGTVEHTFTNSIPAKTACAVFEQKGAGSLSAIHLQIKPTDRATLGQIWIRITWDGEITPAVECPVGAFFGNERGYNRIQTLMQGADKDGRMYCYWPMPFWESAKVELENRGATASNIAISGSVVFKPARAMSYPRERTGHFRASTYQPAISKQNGRDSHIATLRGNGHVVAGLISAEHTSCEGDVRVHIDSCGSPNVQSDGSESWACYGWGFPEPPQSNPAASYDGRGNHDWSMLRLLVGDFYPFRRSLHMTVEGGNGDESGTDIRSGIVLWYGEPEPAMTLSDFLDIGDPESEKTHTYTATNSVAWTLTSMLEGEYDDAKITGQGRTLNGPSEFTVTIEPKNQGVLLRRRSDQATHPQRATVYVNGKQVRERSWLCADINANFRWIEDEFLIPKSYTKGKKSLRIRIEPCSLNNQTNWNESFYWVWNLVTPGQGKYRTVALPAKAIAPFESVPAGSTNAPTASTEK